MFEIGDIVLCDIYVGVVVRKDNSFITCNCSDGKEHVFSEQSVNLVTKYGVMLESFRKGILANVNR